MKKQHTYIKSIIFPKDQFSELTQNITQRYASLKFEYICFEKFYLWSVFATILGTFSTFGDLGSTKFFLQCVQYNYLPKMSIVSNRTHVRICICIMEKEINDRKTKLKNTTQ